MFSTGQAGKEAKKKAQATATSQAKKALQKPRIVYSVPKGQGRKRKPKAHEKRKRAKGLLNKE